MVTHGKGGWDWTTIYNLPVYLRNFYMKQLSDQLDAERKAHENVRKPKMPYTLPTNRP